MQAVNKIYRESDAAVQIFTNLGDIVTKPYKNAAVETLTQKMADANLVLHRFVFLQMANHIYNGSTTAYVEDRFSSLFSEDQDMYRKLMAQVLDLQEAKNPFGKTWAKTLVDIGAIGQDHPYIQLIDQIAQDEQEYVDDSVEPIPEFISMMGLSSQTYQPLVDVFSETVRNMAHYFSAVVLEEVLETPTDELSKDSICEIINRKLFGKLALKNMIKIEQYQESDPRMAVFYVIDGLVTKRSGLIYQIKFNLAEGGQLDMAKEMLQKNDDYFSNAKAAAP